MSTITCKEEMKGNAKCKNSRFEPPFGDSGVAHGVRLWLDGKSIVDFQLAIIELFSLALTAAALLSEICRNRNDNVLGTCVSAELDVLLSVGRGMRGASRQLHRQLQSRSQGG